MPAAPSGAMPAAPSNESRFDRVTELDLSGLKCPLPALRTRKALRALAPGSGLAVICTDPLCGLDIPNLVREEGDRLEAQTRDDTVFRFLIRRRSA